MIVNVNCIVFHVTNLDRAREFYQNVLDLELRETKKDYVAFRCHGVEIGLELEGDNKRIESAPEVYFLVDDIENWTGNLENKGVNIIEGLRKEDWGGTVITITDPDENLIHLVQFGK
jgi:predicted enzyme related to lactoylglutathione lyase